MNPYRWLDSLYRKKIQHQFVSRPKDALQPHVYFTANAAYNSMLENSMNQSILVSGESGAGKTETTKILMNYIASIAGGLEDSAISRVIEMNPLWEAFGNATTVRNDNSSRFGKFTQMQFSSEGTLIGAECKTYLLEKSRVVSIENEERNYHIFYQMLAGLSKRDLEKLQLDRKHKYKYTGKLTEKTIEGVDDKAQCTKTREALKTIHLSEKEEWYETVLRKMSMTNSNVGRSSKLLLGFYTWVKYSLKP